MNYQILPGARAEKLILKSLHQRENPRWVLHGEFHEVDGQRGSQKQEMVSRWSPVHGFIADELDDDEVPLIQEHLRKAGELTPAGLLEKFRQESEEDYEGEDFTGDWPSRTPTPLKHFGLARNLLAGFLSKSLITAIPVEEAWQIPAYVHLGGFNSCPHPEEHCVLWQYWQEKYDAHIVAISHDTIEAAVLRPPQTRDVAMALAWEHFYYCEDNVVQGTETVSDLAALLLNSDKWFFWWD